jgi:AcrR family transcriptional regulator
MEPTSVSRSEPRPRDSAVRAVPTDAAAEATLIEPVRDGVFFKLPEALPRGRHELTREQVQAAQRERLLAAMTELLAARGYRGFGAGDVARRAGVSLAAYYDCFENKDACVFAGYERFIEVLLTRMTAVDSDGKTSPAIVEGLLRTYLETLQSDLVVARAYQVEIDALGVSARELRRNSLKLFAALIREQVARTSPHSQPPATLTWSAYLGVVYAARQLASDALDETAEPDLIGLGDDIQIWFSDLFRQR